MTSEEINIAVHKSRGFTIVSDGITHCLTPCGPKTERDPEGYLLKECPDYANSLDAMHEVELSMDTSSYRAFSNELYLIALRDNPTPAKRGWLSARARQRAEAYLKTLGKWKEND
jgi:hypothetical protein